MRCLLEKLNQTDSVPPMALLPADWTRTVFIFALLIDTVAMLIGPWARQYALEESVSSLTNYMGLASLPIGVFPFFFTTAPWLVRIRYAFTAVIMWLLFSCFVAVICYLFLGTPVQN